MFDLAGDRMLLLAGRNLLHFGQLSAALDFPATGLVWGEDVLMRFHFHAPGCVCYPEGQN
jgi:hypothetical protein